MVRTALVILIVLIAPSAAPAQTPPAGGLLITVEELGAVLKAPDLVLLHVAERASFFEEGHIAGARFLRYEDFAVDGPDDLGSELPGADEIRRVFEAVGVSDSSRVVLYAQNPVVAARAFFTLDAFGHTRVAILDGGLRAWRAANQPLEKGAAAPPLRPGRFTPRLNPQRIVTAAWIQQQVPGRNLSLVDVRPDPEFTGSDGGMGGVHAAGHIDGARQLTWNALVATDGRFLPADQLKAHLAAAGVVGGRPVAAYCMVGMRASVVYFVARHLGYDARLYDGSIVDWSRRQLPVRTGK